MEGSTLTIIILIFNLIIKKIKEIKPSLMDVDIWMIEVHSIITFRGTTAPCYTINHFHNKGLNQIN